MLDKLAALVSQPSAKSWQAIVRLLDRTHHETPGIETSLRGLQHWPKEISRRCPTSWPATWRSLAEHVVHEQRTYGYYILRICTDKRLLLADGRQAVRLERRVVATQLSHDGTHYVQAGQVGEADLVGGLAIDLPNGAGLLAVPLHVEVKGTTTPISPAQRQRQMALISRGEISLVVRSVEEAICGIAVARDDVLRRLATALAASG